MNAQHTPGPKTYPWHAVYSAAHRAYLIRRVVGAGTETMTAYSGHPPLRYDTKRQANKIADAANARATEATGSTTA